MNGFIKATKQKSKLRLAIEGASGSGKTYSSLVIAQSLGKKIAVIDTEHGSASLYSDTFDFDVLELKPPYEPEKYIEAIKLAENLGYDTLIIDSISHEWNGEGGCLDLVNKISLNSSSNNSYVAWGKVTPRHDKFINSLLQSKLHIICTMRSKANYETGKNDKGRLTYEKKGTAPIQRDSVEYEFTIVFDLNQNHISTVSKDRSGIFDGKDFLITKETGTKLLDWLNSGVEIKKNMMELNKNKFNDSEEIYKTIIVKEDDQPIFNFNEKCSKCNKEVTEKIAEFSKNKFSKVLCFECQKG